MNSRIGNMFLSWWHTLLEDSIIKEPLSPFMQNGKFLFTYDVHSQSFLANSKPN